MKIKMHARMFVAALGVAALFAFSAPAPAATFVQERATTPESVATPPVTQASDDGPSKIIKICCAGWFCWPC